MKQKIGNASKVLGILSICLFWLTWPASVLAIIGLSIKKQNLSRDFSLNIIGLVLSIVYTILIFNWFF